MKENDRLT